MKEKVRIAVMGCGPIGHSHIGAMRQVEDEVSLAAVVDVNKDLAEKTAREHGASKYYTNVEEALDDPGINAVLICLPNHLHCPVAVAAAKAGKHILVEKPVARSCSELDKMIEAAEANKVTMMVGQTYRFFKAWREAKDRVKEIGDLFNVLFRLMTLTKKSGGSSMTQRERAKGAGSSWMEKSECTGGLVYAFNGCHTLDYVMWMFEDKVLESVYSEGYSNNPDYEGSDEAVIVVRFKDGAMATVQISMNMSPPIRECFLLGSKGNIHLSQKKDRALGPWGAGSTKLYLNGNLVMSEEQSVYPFVMIMKEFVDSIKQGREPITSGRKVRRYMQVLDMAQESARRHEVIRLKEEA